MKKITLVSLLSIAAFLIVDNRSLLAIPAGAASESAVFNRPKLVAQLPADLVIPALLPPAIQDPMLLEAWIRVYQQQDPIQLWEGATVSGRSLALYVLEHGIPVEWDTRNVCGNGSCSVLYGRNDGWSYADDKPGVEPIFVAPSQQGDMPSLIRTLAHEAFHRTQPFGPVNSTRYEEYWAFRVGAGVSKAEWPKFGVYDPLDPGQLNLWFRENRMDYYFQIPEYPATVAAQVDRVSSAGDPHAGIAAQASGVPPTR